MSNYQAVITRYNEDVEWVKTFDDYIVFNKGSNAGISQEILNRTYNLPNLGQDVENILRYITTHYNSLPDKIAFCQGKYQDHYPLTLSEFKHQLLTLENGYSTLSYNNDKCTIEYGNKPSFNIREWPPNHKLENYKPEYNLEKWWNEISNEKYEQKPIIFWGSIFCVHKSLIHRRPLSFYEKMHKYYIKNVNPVELHFAERTWANIFKIQQP
jgi:hypothetical protein